MKRQSIDATYDSGATVYYQMANPLPVILISLSQQVWAGARCASTSSRASRST